MKKLIALLLALAMVFALAACTGNNGEANNPGGDVSNNPGGDVSNNPGGNDTPNAGGDANSPYGGEVVCYTQEFHNDYDPAISPTRNYALWYDSLFGMDYSLDVGEVYNSSYLSMGIMTGLLAESYTFENSVLTVKLREGVHFQTLPAEYDYYGGRELVASDIKWTYDRLLGTGSGHSTPVNAEQDWPTVLYMIDSIETDGDYTVIFNFNTASEQALDSFFINQVCVAGPEWDELSPEQQNDWHYACGTGAYILDDYAPDNYMHFVKNENYWGTDVRAGYEGNQLPYMDGVKLQLVSDSTGMTTQFAAGNLDILTQPMGSPISATEEQLLPAGSYKAYIYYGNPQNVGLKQTSNEALANATVRKALQYAVDMEACQVYLGYDPNELNLCGLWTRSSEFSSFDEWSPELLAEYTTHDVEYAKQLLAEAGYPNGFTFHVCLMPQMDSGLYQLIASQLAEAGVTMELYICNDNVENQQLGTDLNSPYSSMTRCGIDSFSTLTDAYTASGSHYEVGWVNDEFLSLISEFQGAQTMSEATRIAKEMDTLWSQEHLLLYMGGAEQSKCFVSSRVGGYDGERFAGWNALQIFAHMWVNG